VTRTDGEPDPVEKPGLPGPYRLRSQAAHAAERSIGARLARFKLLRSARSSVAHSLAPRAEATRFRLEKVVTKSSGASLPERGRPRSKDIQK
jgi:hypothetical protein